MYLIYKTIYSIMICEPYRTTYIAKINSMVEEFREGSGDSPRGKKDTGSGALPQRAMSAGLLAIWTFLGPVAG